MVTARTDFSRGARDGFIAAWLLTALLAATLLFLSRGSIDSISPLPYRWLAFASREGLGDMSLFARWLGQISEPPQPMPTVPYGNLIYLYASRENIDPAFLTAVIDAESKFDAHAISRSGARGLGQLMPIMIRWCGISDPFDPEQNLSCSARFLADLQRAYDGDVTLMAAAYNAGEPAVNACMCVPNNGETPTYVRRVLAAYDRYRGDVFTIGPVYSLPTRVTQDMHGLNGWEGIDIKAGCGAEIHAPITGTVTYNGRDGYVGPYDERGEQNTILSISDGVNEFTMLHGEYWPEEGTTVVVGQVIGREADIGNATGCHTHLVWKVNDQVTNPSTLLSGR